MGANFNEPTALLSEFGDLLSVKDLATIFNVSRKTIYKELRMGKFGKPIKIGRAFIVPKAFIISQFIANYL